MMFNGGVNQPTFLHYCLLQGVKRPREIFFFGDIRVILFNITIQYTTLQGIRLTYTNNNTLIHLRLLHTLLTLFTILVTFLLHFAHLLLSLLINTIITTIILKKINCYQAKYICLT